MAAEIRIRVADTTGQGLREEITVAVGTTVGQLCDLRHGTDWESRLKVRVNGLAVEDDYVLQDQDLVSWSAKKQEVA